MISSMGTVEAIISDNVISEFKQNVVKRKGDTLGDFSSALEHAYKGYILVPCIQWVRGSESP